MATSVIALDDSLPSIVTAKTEFYKLANPLDELNGTEKSETRIIAATKRGHLLELKSNGELFRFHKLQERNVEKILVHHVFQPYTLYVALLSSSQTVVLFSYNQFQVIHKWKNATQVTSEDRDGVGFPLLFISFSDGETKSFDSTALMLLTDQVDVDAKESNFIAKSHAATALSNQLKDGVRHVQSLDNQLRCKESFVAQRLASLQLQLQGGQPELHPEKLFGPCPNNANSTGNITGLNVLEVLPTRHKIVHNKWVIGVSVTNRMERHLVWNPELTLHISGCEIISYKTRTLKTVMRKKNSMNRQSSEQQISIEELSPPVLRPGKHACLIAICELPSFSENPVVTCSGVISFNCRPLSIVDVDLEQNATPAFKLLDDSHIYQVPFAVVQLSAQEMQCHMITIDQSPAKKIISFSVVALVASSAMHKVTFKSLSSPLSNFVKVVNSRVKVVQMSGVSQLYCCIPGSDHPLQYAAFMLQFIDAQHVDVSLYTRDDNQSIILMYTFIETLPKDVFVDHCDDTRNSHDSAQDVEEQLVSCMKTLVASLVEGCRSAEQKRYNKKSKIHSSVLDLPDLMVPGDRELFVAKREDVELEPELYVLMKTRVADVQCKMDDLYVKCVHKLQ